MVSPTRLQSHVIRQPSVRPAGRPSVLPCLGALRVSSPRLPDRDCLAERTCTAFERVPKGRPSGRAWATAHRGAGDEGRGEQTDRSRVSGSGGETMPRDPRLSEASEPPPCDLTTATRPHPRRGASSAWPTYHLRQLPPVPLCRPVPSRAALPVDCGDGGGGRRCWVWRGLPGAEASLGFSGTAGSLAQAVPGAESSPPQSVPRVTQRKGGEPQLRESLLGCVLHFCSPAALRPRGKAERGARQPATLPTRFGSLRPPSEVPGTSIQHPRHALTVSSLRRRPRPAPTAPGRRLTDPE